MMTARALAVAISLLVALLGCGDPTGPSPGIDLSLVGTWVDEGRATDTSGVLLCTYVQMGLVLHGTGQFDWHFVELVSASMGDCDETTSTKDSGQWHTQSGKVTFTPPPPITGVEETTLELPYELDGDELRISFLTFKRE